MPGIGNLFPRLRLLCRRTLQDRTAFATLRVGKGVEVALAVAILFGCSIAMLHSREPNQEATKQFDIKGHTDLQRISRWLAKNHVLCHS